MIVSYGDMVEELLICKWGKQTFLWQEEIIFIVLTIAIICRNVNEIALTLNSFVFFWNFLGHISLVDFFEKLLYIFIFIIVLILNLMRN